MLENFIIVVVEKDWDWVCVIVDVLVEMGLYKIYVLFEVSGFVWFVVWFLLDVVLVDVIDLFCDVIE